MFTDARARLLAVEELATLERELTRRRTLGSLKVFVTAAWPLVEPEHPLVWNWHLDVLADVLTRMAAGEVPRAIFNVPPGTMKSLLVSVFYRAWLWARNPQLRFLAASYGSHLSVRDNVKLRDIITSSWYRTMFPGVTIAGDQNAKERFDTTAGGWSIATSVGGVGTGEHPDYIIIDDPHTAAQAQSATERQSAADWFDHTISTRGVVRNARTALVMQRLHQEDLTGHLLGKEQWLHVCLPMRFDPTARDSRDPRTEAGELLWPALFDEARVRKLEADLGPYGTASQLQQRPAPEGGGTFRREWFRVIDELPSEVPAATTRFWDVAGTEGAGDYTVGLKLTAYRSGLYVVTHVIRGQWSDGHVDELICATAQLDGRRVRVREEQEPGSSGKAVIAARTRKLAGYDYRGVRSTGPKLTRWAPLVVQAAAGNVALLAGPWVLPLLDELTLVPFAAHDDQADAFSGAFTDLALRYGAAGERKLVGY
jgi:predicted phage terminase large subunit-like protein